MRVFAADIGFGTTDILLYDSSRPLENCPKLVVPSQTQIVAAEIRRATRHGLGASMDGVTMSGGPCGAALRKHLTQGLLFFASPAAALTFHDDLEKIASWGVTIVDDPVVAAPTGSVRIQSGDLNLPALERAFTDLGIGFDFDGAAIAVQDHGFSPSTSNRRHRFDLWREALDREAHISRLAFPANAIPEPYSRMRAVASLLHDFDRVVLMDTGPAALLGATLSGQMNPRDRGQAPLLVANFGNGHTLAAIIENGCINGLVEHHTGLLNREKFESLLARFTAATLSNEEVFDDGGHGCVPPGHAFQLADLEPVIITGPRREMARGGELKLEFAAPHGDMMLTGCFGLIEAWKEATSSPGA